MKIAAKRRLLKIAFLLGALWLVLIGRSLVERVAGQMGNPVSTSPPYAIGTAAQALHERLFVADMHADTLLAARDPTQSAGYGQLDLPRLRTGHVRIQVFSIVTNMPLCPGLHHCGRNPNLVALLATVQGWPVETWTSDEARALHQAAKLRNVTTDRTAGLILLEDVDNLVRLLKEPRVTQYISAVLAIEGAQAPLRLMIFWLVGTT